MLSPTDYEVRFFRHRSLAPHRMPRNTPPHEKAVYEQLTDELNTERQKKFNEYIVIGDRCCFEPHLVRVPTQVKTNVQTWHSYPAVDHPAFMRSLAGNAGADRLEFPVFEIVQRLPKKRALALENNDDELGADVDLDEAMNGGDKGTSSKRPCKRPKAGKSKAGDGLDKHEVEAIVDKKNSTLRSTRFLPQSNTKASFPEHLASIKREQLSKCDTTVRALQLINTAGRKVLAHKTGVLFGSKGALQPGERARHNLVLSSVTDVDTLPIFFVVNVASSKFTSLVARMGKEEQEVSLESADVDELVERVLCEHAPARRHVVARDKATSVHDAGWSGILYYLFTPLVLRIYDSELVLFVLIRPNFQNNQRSGPRPEQRAPGLLGTESECKSAHRSRLSPGWVQSPPCRYQQRQSWPATPTRHRRTSRCTSAPSPAA